MLTDRQIIAKYGEPGDYDNFTYIQLPYPLRIAWDLSKSVNKILCHKLIAENLSNVFKELLALYGYEKLVELGIDLFGGCVNVRAQRGSKNRWSRHSWGIAIDLDPARNSLKTPWRRAQFSKPDYKFMVDTFYKHEFFNYGKDRDFDAMHWEIVS